MNKEFIEAIEALEKEKDISKDILIEAIESALVSAYKKNYGNEAYAALILKKAACSGYARAYKLLCEAAGIPVRHVNAGSWTHQWNEIKANGKWIKVDAYGGTFADTTGIRKSLLKENKNKEQLVFKFVMEEEE